jgi:inositol 1,4,5-triphosphate receptor type 3
LTTLNQGIRAGGGIGEYMRPSDPFGGNSIQGGDVKQDTYRYWVFRLIFDLGFFLMLNIVLLNLVFGIIIDTFAERRFARQEKNVNKNQFCFICDVSRRKFDQLGIGFKHHTNREHK